VLFKKNNGYEINLKTNILLFICFFFNKGCKLPTVRLYDVVEAWKKIAHANIVQLREVFLTKDFDDEQPCIYFVFLNIYVFI
jgi:hypothetical protein